jgi:hypothetical protein
MCPTRAASTDRSCSVLSQLGHRPEHLRRALHGDEALCTSLAEHWGQLPHLEWSKVYPDGTCSSTSMRLSLSSSFTRWRTGHQS